MTSDANGDELRPLLTPSARALPTGDADGSSDRSQAQPSRSLCSVRPNRKYRLPDHSVKVTPMEQRQHCDARLNCCAQAAFVPECSAASVTIRRTQVRRFIRRMSRRHRAIAATAAVAVAAAGVTLGISITQHDRARPRPISYRNISRNFRACLLTSGAPTDLSRDTWHAMQKAGSHAAINAQHINAPEVPAAQLAPYLNSLIAMHCGLIVTAGMSISSTVETAARKHPKQEFLTVGKSSKHGPTNVHALGRSAHIAPSVTRFVLRAAHDHGAVHPRPTTTPTK